MADEQDIHEYPGEQVDVRWDRRLCIHVGECGRAEGELFVGGRAPWCDPNVVGDDVEHVVDVVERCPTGALTYIRKQGGATEVAPGRNQVVVANDGPLYLSGDLAIDGASEDMAGVRFRAALCRCGASKTKPFCDNSHRELRFEDQGAVGSTGEPSIEEGGRLEVKRAPNGPLLVNGSFTIVGGSGRVAWRGTRAALCRCGASKNKPFCDGAHKAIGFQAD
ncbi:Iron-binding zinc finger CDGSH type [Enhygromyxa salina]|uniref:Iron-binding zinc finger CDGSH type n=1 Tax=Enhygromyxa salina TaxID=215803 RepID=A0A2S9XKL1_9BACT|nr:CDGSH iron-sulfur domain-containing protein [Enhygromyxa salina]PRP93211.1 Iron-binding zinc finger CDGSH type [Enhygromyxa salina]